MFLVFIPYSFCLNFFLFFKMLRKVGSVFAAAKAFLITNLGWVQNVEVSFFHFSFYFSDGKIPEHFLFFEQ